ncbi:MAG: C69 family dipeptidase [Coriobacteriaceae bacterium]|nr:C69 family dipeptidase [Coriobacteriaceae bacterium]
MRISIGNGGPSRLRRAACGIMAGAVLFTAAPLSAFACTQVWVPGQFTANGDRYVGRSEDYASRHLKIFGIEEPQANTHYTSEESGFDWTSDKTSYRYTYVRDHPSDWSGRSDAYSEAGINEHGVSCSATLTTNMNAEMEKIDPLSETGIGEYNYASVILGECKTAREGVELLGRLIDEQGASGNDQITISDPEETWLFCALSGHQWVGFKMPEDQVSVNPNMGNLRFKVDLDDAENCLHSKGILSVPEEAGLLKTYEDGTPDIASTYGVSDAKHSSGTTTRYVQGRHYFEAPLPEGSYEVTPGKGVTRLDEPTQFFTPGRSGWTTNEILRSLAARGEGTDVDANKDAAFGAIGNNRTVESHMFQIRDGLSSDIATVQWECLSRTEFSIYVPLYSALLTQVSPYFSDLSCDETHQGPTQKDDVEWAMQEEPENSLPFVLMDINTLAYNHRDSMAVGVRAYLDAMQAQIIAQQDAVDALMQATPAEGRTELANKAQMAVVEQVYLKCNALLDEMRAYIKAGDFTQPFAASDMNADGTDLATPVVYADAVVAPSITQQPVSATYKQGAAASDLTVTASSASGSALSYEWFVKTGDTVTSTGVKTANMPVSTEKAGETTYFCRVTNAAGLSVDSDAVTVVVTAVKPPVDPDPDKPGTTDPTPSKPSHKPGGSLPQTGDPLSMLAMAGMALTGAGATVCGARTMRRNRRSKVQ